MKIINLDIKEQLVNTISISIQNTLMGGDIDVSFFEPGKFANAYAEVSPSIEYEEKDLDHYLYGVSGKVKLYLPEGYKYGLKINGEESKCVIKNGKLHSADIKTLSIRLENVSSISNINNIRITPLPDGNITLINSSIDSISGDLSQIYTYNTKINRLSCSSIYYDVNLLNTKINDMILYIPKLKHQSKFEASNSEFDDIRVMDGNVKLVESKIKDVRCFRCDEVQLLNCKYKKEGNIVLTEGVNVMIKNKEYRITRTSINTRNIYEKETHKHLARIYTSKNKKVMIKNNH